LRLQRAKNRGDVYNFKAATTAPCRGFCRTSCIFSVNYHMESRQQEVDDCFRVALCNYPAPPHLMGYGCSGSTSAEQVHYELGWICCDVNNSFDERFRFWRVKNFHLWE